MQTIQVTVPFKEGLRARPATELVKVCQVIKSNISLIKDSTHVNPKSIPGIMSLGASYGTPLTLEVNGVDESEGAALLSKFFEGEISGKTACNNGSKQNRLHQYV